MNGEDYTKLTTKGERITAQEKADREAAELRDVNIQNSLQRSEEGLARLDKILEDIQGKLGNIKDTNEYQELVTAALKLVSTAQYHQKPNHYIVTVEAYQRLMNAYYNLTTD